MTVNYNTALRLAHLLFSLFRVLGRDQFVRVLIVDNASTDDSLPLLRKLQDAGLAETIINRTQHYHGPALNQAFNHLARRRRNPRAADDLVDYIWVLDSDTIVLRPDTIAEACRCLRLHGAGVVGQLQFDVPSLPDGYAHISSLLVDPQLTWRRHLEPFQESGTPAEGFQMVLRKHGIGIHDFPFMRDQYILHIGAGTVETLREADFQNRYKEWSTTAMTRHFHGNPAGPLIFEAFKKIFDEHVGTQTPDALIDACARDELVTIPCSSLREQRREESLAT
ncbi:MAG: glycosyltransferase family 2 protein [Planctomycetaceae bacterium]